MDDGGEGFDAALDGFSGRRCRGQAHAGEREVLAFAQADENEARRGHALMGIQHGGLFEFAAEVAGRDEVRDQATQGPICRACRAARFRDAFKEVEHDGVCVSFEDIADGSGDVHGENPF